MIELKHAFLIAASMLFVSPSLSQGYEKLPEDKVDQNKVKLAIYRPTEHDYCQVKRYIWQ
jgi:hypothetical protein